MKHTHSSSPFLLALASLLAFAVAFSGAGCSRKAPQGKILATYDGGSVTEGDFMKAVRSMPEHVRVVAQEKKNEFLDSFVLERILLQEAETARF